VTSRTAGRIANAGEIGYVIGVTGCTGIFHLMATVTAKGTHFRGLGQKAGALNRGFRPGTAFLVTKTTFTWIAGFEVSGTTPTGMQPHTVLTRSMFVIGFFMTTTADFSVNWRIAPYDCFVIRTMT
jgi:hypothetical protein